MLNRIIFTLSVITALCTTAAAQRLDSIARLINNVDDTLKIKYLDTLAYEHENLDSIMKYSTELYHLATKLENNGHKYNALMYFGYVYYYRDEMQLAINCYHQVLDIAEKENDIHKKGICHRKIATAYSQLGNYNLSDNYYNKALAEFRQTGDSSRIASVLRYQGYTYIDFNVFQMGNNNFREAYRIDQARHDSLHMTEDLFNIGRSQYRESMYLSDNNLLDSARNTLNTAYFMYLSKIPTTMKVHILKYLIDVYTGKAFNAANKREKSQYADSLRYFINLINDKRDVLGMNTAEDYMIYEATYTALMGNTGKAISLLDKSSQSIQKDEKKYNTSYTDLCHAYLLIYRNIGDYRNELKYTKLLLEYERKKRSQDFLMSASNNKYEDELNDRKNSEKLLKLEVSDQKTITTILQCAMAIAIILIAIIGQAFKRNRKNAKQLAVQNIEIAQQRDMLKTANKKTMAALQYAGRIQSAALPGKDIFEKTFSEYFVILHPLNIVSGDFYWAARRRALTFVAVADCTGHGVPGAFLSMLSIASLNDLILSIEYEKLSAALILDSLREKIIKSLHQTQDINSTSDGLDISLIIYHPGQSTIQYAGAHRPLWIVSGGSLTETKGDSQPVGIHLGKAKPFSNHTIQVSPGDTLYMFSDGITDQIDSSGCHNKYSPSQLKAKITAMSAMNLKEQKTRLDDDFQNWRLRPDGTLEPQLDDQILLAVKI